MKLFSKVVILFCFLTMYGLDGIAASSEDTNDNDAKSSNFVQAREAINAGSFEQATSLLQLVLDEDPDNADAHNFLGLAHRKLGNLELSGSSYITALSINPEHLGALEYQGELYLKLGDVPAARKNLALLRSLCGTDCQEFRELQRVVDDFEATQNR